MGVIGQFFKGIEVLGGSKFGEIGNNEGLFLPLPAAVGDQSGDSSSEPYGPDGYFGTMANEQIHAKDFGFFADLSTMLAMERLLFLDPTVIETNPDQPRKHFDEEELKGLADSIQTLGFIQPLVVREHQGHFRLVAGERRLRAAKMAGMAKVPVVVKNRGLNAQEALAENLQRSDLNPLETARALQRLLSNQALSQDTIAKQLGMNRSSLANYLRLLQLPEEVQVLIEKGMITMGHAKALLMLEDPKQQIKLAYSIAKGKVSVRQLEKVSKKPAPTLEKAARELADKLGTRVAIEGQPKGRITIDYFNLDDLDRILAEFGIELC